jgi:hypothetical protein
MMAVFLSGLSRKCGPRRHRILTHGFGCVIMEISAVGAMRQDKPGGRDGFDRAQFQYHNVGGSGT